MAHLHLNRFRIYCAFKWTVCCVVFSITALLTVNIIPQKPRYSDEDVEWLVRNVYFEARNQSVTGQLAVLMVTLNRMQSGYFPRTVKGVVTQGGAKVKHKCQFSWYCDGKPDVITDRKSYESIKSLVLQVLPVAHTIHDVTGGALFYHATYVRPLWAKQKELTAKIEKHIFYK